MTETISTLKGTSGADTLTGTDAAERLYGLAGDDTLIAGGGADILNGGTGSDAMQGGSGADTYYVDSTGDTVSEAADDDALDKVVSYISYVLPDHVEKLTLAGTAADGTGNALDNTLSGNASDNVLSGEAGNDTLSGGAGNDTLLGGEGNDRLNGGTGADILVGGAGADIYYVDDLGDTVDEITGQAVDDGAVDHVVSSVSYALGARLEKLTLSGTLGIAGLGNELDNSIAGNAGDNVLSGDAGNDRLSGGAGDDLLDGGIGNDILSGGTGRDRLLGGEGDDSLNGGDGDDILEGGAGADRLTGGLGADVLRGGAGADIYYVDDLGDTVDDLTGQGVDDGAIDHVVSSVSFALGAGLEKLTLTGTAGLAGWGNALDNSIAGTAGNNSLSGGAGADTLSGGAGNDWLDGGTGIDKMYGGAGADYYVVDDVKDQAVESAGTDDGAWDVVLSTVTFTLGARIEVLVLSGAAAINGTGNSGANYLYGNDAANTLYGAAGADYLDGGLGADILRGGAGADTYVVGAGDTVDETYGQKVDDGAVDSVLSTVSFTLAKNVENLTLQGTDALSGTGNDLKNLLAGNDATNVLSGAGGDDDLFGNGGNDTLEGGTGADYLDGGTGADTLRGGAGADRYVVDHAGDVVDELAGVLVDDGAIDTVFATVSHALSAHVEQLRLQGSDALSGTGNALANFLEGNDGDNILSGLAGDDYLVGGGGADRLVGGAGYDILEGRSGADVFVVETGTGVDQVADFTIGADRVELDAAFGYSSAAQVMGVAEQWGADAVFKLSDADTLVLKGIQLSDLGESDFLFA